MDEEYLINVWVLGYRSLEVVEQRSFERPSGPHFSPFPTLVPYLSPSPASNRLHIRSSVRPSLSIMRLQLTLISVVYPLATKTLLAHPSNVLVDFDPSTHFSRITSLHKRALGSSVEILKDVKSFDTPSPSSTTRTLAELLRDEEPPETVSVSSMARPNAHIAPLHFVGRSATDKLEPRRQEEIEVLQAQFIAARRAAKNNAEAEAVINRNLNRLAAERVAPEMLSAVPHLPAWVVQEYEQSWNHAGLDPKSMAALGSALGITERGVKPISAEAFDRLHSFVVGPVDGESEIGLEQITWSHHPQSDEMLQWFRNHNMITLSSKHQEVLEFNIAQSQKKPWWTREQIKIWKEQSLPWKQMAQIGTLLEIGSDQPIMGNEITRVRKQIVQILDQFSASHDIEDQPYRIPVSDFGWIAEQLRQASLLPRSKQVKNLRSNFDLKFRLISGGPKERAEIRLQILNGNLHNIQDVKVRDLVRMHLLIRGVSPMRAADFSEALNFVRSNSIMKLLKSGAEINSKLEALFPKLERGFIYPISTYKRLKIVFRDFLGGKTLEDASSKASFVIATNDAGFKAKTSLLALWKGGKKS